MPRLQWHPDVCKRATFRPVMRTAEQLPAGENDPRLNYAELLSTHLVRVCGVDCRRTIGTVHVDLDAYGRGYIATSRPDGLIDRLHSLRADLNADNYGVFRGTYHGPESVSAIYTNAPPTGSEK